MSLGSRRTRNRPQQPLQTHDAYGPFLLLDILPRYSSSYTLSLFPSLILRRPPSQLVNDVITRSVVRLRNITSSSCFLFVSSYIRYPQPSLFHLFQLPFIFFLFFLIYTVCSCLPSFLLLRNLTFLLAIFCVSVNFNITPPTNFSTSSICPSGPSSPSPVFNFQS